MAEAVVTKIAKRKMVQARAGVKALPKITGMVFGNGAVAEDGTITPPAGEDTSLKNELLRKAVDKFEELTETSYRYTCTLAKTELGGVTVNEIALYDEDGDLVAIKSFSNKGKDEDMEMIFEIDDTF